MTKSLIKYERYEIVELDRKFVDFFIAYSSSPMAEKVCNKLLDYSLWDSKFCQMGYVLCDFNYQDNILKFTKKSSRVEATSSPSEEREICEEITLKINDTSQSPGDNSALYNTDFLAEIQSCTLGELRVIDTKIRKISSCCRQDGQGEEEFSIAKLQRVKSFICNLQPNFFLEDGKASNEVQCYWDKLLNHRSEQNDPPNLKNITLTWDGSTETWDGSTETWDGSTDHGLCDCTIA